MSIPSLITLFPHRRAATEGSRKVGILWAITNDSLDWTQYLLVVAYQYYTALDLLIYLFSLTLTYGSTIFNLFGLRNFFKVTLISAWIFVHINLKILPKTSNSYDHLATAPLQGKVQIFIVSRFHPTTLDPREEKHFIHSWNRTQVLLLPRKASDHTILSKFHHTTILVTPLDPRGGKTLRQSWNRTKVILQS